MWCRARCCSRSPRDCRGSVVSGSAEVLIVTGPLLIWLKYGGAAGFTVWFTIKMVFVVILLVSVIASGVLGKRLEQGDMSVMPWLPSGVVNTLSLLAITLCAVFAFG